MEGFTLVPRDAWRQTETLGSGEVGVVRPAGDALDWLVLLVLLRLHAAHRLHVVRETPGRDVDVDVGCRRRRRRHETISTATTTTIKHSLRSLSVMVHERGGRGDVLFSSPEKKEKKEYQ